MVNDVLQDLEDRMQKSIVALEEDFKTVRTGRASPALIERIMVPYYGTLTPLNQMATIAAPEASLLTIRPWDASALGDIERAILKSDLGLTPNNDGKIIRLAIPPLTEERRRELTKVVGKRVEEARVSVRNIRRDGLQDLQDLQKESLISEDEYYRARDKTQDLTDKYVKEINEVGKAKEEEIMEI
ncbi:MAG: ribosome recycling factor [Chloroflexi bacterium]|nr:ribosome recycling factor [Chloroflexota bacterium]